MILIRICLIEEDGVMEEIYVWRKQPGELPEFIKIKNDLKTLQDYVGGYIETVTIASNKVVICNEEGLLMGMPYNCTIKGIDFVGPVIMAGIKGDEFASFPVRKRKKIIRECCSTLK